MPPWFIEKDIGIQHFKDDISLSEEEIEKIAIWVDSGAPLGNPADLPPEADGRQAEPFSSTALRPKFQLTWPLGTKWGGAVPQLTRRVAFGRAARLRGGTPPF